MSTLRSSAIFAAVTAMAGLVPLWRAPRPVRLALTVGSGIAAGGAGYLAMRRPDLTARVEGRDAGRDAGRAPAGLPVSVAVGSAAAGVAAGATAAGIALDGAAERFLARRDVRHPRVALGLAGGVIAFVSDVLDRRFDSGESRDAS